MVKVRIVQNIGAGVAGAAALVSVTPACSAPAGEDLGHQAAANTEAAPAGSGEIELRYYEFSYRSTSGGDEFLRAGEKLTLKVDFQAAYYVLATRNSEAAARVAGDPSKVRAAIEASYQLENGTEVSRGTYPITWSGSGNSAGGKTDEFLVPTGAPRMVLKLVAEEIGGDGARAEAGSDVFRHAKFAVFGAYGDNKLALFDNDEGGRPRTRIVEGGAFTPGKDATLSITDWRLDRAVDRYNLDTAIGDGKSYSRFGSVDVVIQGRVTYEVEVAYSTDGGRTWQNGGRLDEHKDPAVLNVPDGSFRTAYEKTLRLPADAQDLELAFHVKAFLIADPQYQYVQRWRNNYQLGGKYLLKDAWDNNGGQNYRLPVAP